jgi:hypothetical protein
MRKNVKKRTGNVAVLTAVSLVCIFGIGAIALDGGLLQHDRRMAQAAADAAAMAAADDLYLNWQANAGLDLSGTAQTKALAIAKANGFNNNGVDSSVTVNIPPLSGLHAGQAGYVEVIVHLFQRRGFSGIWGSSRVTVSARAVAAGQWSSFRIGILVLDPYSAGSLNDNGTGSCTVQNADIIVDSNAPNGAIGTGGCTLTAPNFYLTGVPGTSTSGGATFHGAIFDGQTPTPDPLAYLPEPDPNSMPVQSNNPVHASSSTTLDLQPGVYQGGITVSGKAGLNMAPGIYYMQGGGFSFTGQGNLTAPGVMIVNDPKSNADRININGNGAVNLSAPSTGIYKGISLWQIRSSTNTVEISGNGGTQMTGTFYAQHGTLKVTGNGGNDVLGSQYISWNVNLGGNGSWLVRWQPQPTARTRVLYLVE